MTYNGLGIAEGWDFSIKVQSKNESWILHKYSIKAVQFRFWQYLVRQSCFFYL